MRTLIAVICFVGTIGIAADVAFAVGSSPYASFGSYITAVAYCSDGRKIISQGCYMTEDEAQTNAVVQCQSRQEIPLFTYSFNEVQECENFRQEYLQSLTAQAEIFERIASGRQEELEIELLISSTSLRPKITPKEAQQQLHTANCGCQEIVMYLADFLIPPGNGKQVNTCKFISDKVQQGIALKVCGVAKISNFFLGKACSWSVKTAVSFTFLRPICDSLLDYLDESFNLDLIHFSSKSLKTKGANLVCSNLFSSNKRSNLYKQSRGELTGIWRTALEYIGVCGSSSLEILLRK